MKWSFSINTQEVKCSEIPLYCNRMYEVVVINSGLRFWKGVYPDGKLNFSVFRRFTTGKTRDTPSSSDEDTIRRVLGNREENGRCILRTGRLDLEQERV